MSNTNQHIIDYLNWYLSEKCKMRAAVMLTGSWGSGKTHFLKNEYMLNEPKRFIYISLNGIASAEDIDALLIQSLHLLLESKGVKIGGEIAKSFLKNAY